MQIVTRGHFGQGNAYSTYNVKLSTTIKTLYHAIRLIVT